jgi:hypothetical protein
MGSAKVQRMVHWLIVLSWVAVIFGLLTAFAIAFDVTAHPQHMKIMNAVWPITGLYLPVVATWLYSDMAPREPKSMPGGHAAHGRRSFWKSVFVSTTHCAAGCVIGDILGAPSRNRRRRLI